MPKGAEHNKNLKKKAKYTLMEKRLRKKEKKAKEIGSSAVDVFE